VVGRDPPENFGRNLDRAEVPNTIVNALPKFENQNAFVLKNLKEKF
jgi:hypothetical protein